MLRAKKLLLLIMTDNYAIRLIKIVKSLSTIAYISRIIVGLFCVRNIAENQFHYSKNKSKIIHKENHWITLLR